MAEYRLSRLIYELNYYDMNARLDVARKLGELGDPRAFAILLPLLDSQDAGLIHETIEAMLKIDRTVATELLLHRLRDSDSEARGHLIYYLNGIDEQLFDPALVPQLAELVIAELRKESCVTRCQAAQLLGSLAYPAAIEVLTSVLSDEEDGLRQDAAISLGHLGDNRAFDALLAALDAEEGQEFMAAENMAAALRKLGGTRAFDLRSASLLAKLEDADPTVRKYAAAALRGFADPRALEALAAHVRDEDNWVRIHSSCGLAAMGEAGMLRLIELTSDPDVDVRQRAAYNLVAFKDERAIITLLNIVDDQEMMAVATDALARIVPERTIELISQRISSTNGEIQMSWLERLDYIGDNVIEYHKLTSAVEALLALLDNANLKVQEAAINLLGKIYDPRSFPALLQLLKADNANLRCIALRALSGKATPLTFDILSAMLHDADSNVRNQAIAELGYIDDKRVVDLLLPLLQNADELVRDYAVDALSRLRDRRTVPFLLPLLHDENSYVRFDTVGALGMIGDPSVLPSLREMVNSMDEPQPNLQRTLKYATQQVIRHLEHKTQLSDNEELTMLIMNLDKVSRYYGVRAIFTALSWQIGEGEKIGLVGPNGAGKSSLLRFLAGIDQPDEGTVVPRKGVRSVYLPQEVPAEEGDTPLSVALSAKPELARLNAAIEQAEAAFADPDIYSDMSRLDEVSEQHSRLLEEYEAGGGPRLLNLASGLLRDLGFSDEELHEPLITMSGGQKKLAHIARCILGEPDLLLLDEPDNHLDLERKARLEAVIRQFPGTVIVISHDRYLLDETVTQIAELEDGKLKTYNGDYSSYAVQKQLAQAQAMADYQSQQKEIQRLELVVQRFRDWAARTADKERLVKQARATQKRIDRIERVDKPVLERRRMGLELRAGGRGGQKVVELRDLSKSFSANGHAAATVLTGLQGLVRNGERVGVVGANGAGKSVLFRLIAGELAPSGGAVWVGPSINLGLYTQEHQSLDMNNTLVDTVRLLKPMYEGQAYAFLGRFMFGYEQANRLVSTLSGGEKARLQLACLMLGTANCLLLDEPTNNLDIQSAEVLEQALDNYPGTVIVISHDRYFLDRVVDRIWELRDGTLREFDGGWSEYAETRM